jgi:hypothetical protein
MYLQHIYYNFSSVHLLVSCRTASTHSQRWQLEHQYKQYNGMPNIKVHYLEVILLSPLQTNAETAPLFRTKLLPSTRFPIHCSRPILPLDVTQDEILTNTVQ